MAIHWDTLLVHAYARQLDRKLGGGRLRSFLLDHERRSLVLWLREATLVARLEPARGTLLLLEAEEPPDEARPLAAEVRAIEAIPDDRVLLVHVRKVRGGRERWTFVLELIPNRWNVVVAEEDAHAPHRIRHVLDTREGDRRIAVGEAWAPPEPTRREGVDGELPEARWRELLEDVPPEERRGVLLSNVAWTSGLNADAVLRGDAAEGGAFDAAAARRRWRVLLEAREAEAGWILDPGGAADGPHPYPAPLPGRDAEPVGSLAEAFRTVAGRDVSGALTAIPSAWVAALEKRAGAAAGRVRGLERELEGAEDPAPLRAVGDLLLARFGEVPRGAERVALTDFEGREVEIELDPTAGPQENAASWYDRAARAERARRKLPDLVADAEVEAERLAGLLERVRSGEASPEEVRAELPEESTGTAGGGEAPSLPYRTYRSTGGLEIRVGRGSRRNDDLTFHHARPDDVWLHARHAAGAHVVLRWQEEGAPPSRDLAEAAILAALHSKARTSGSVPVDWTRRKYVRKPRGAVPGAVVPDRVQTVFVEPDPALEERLRA